MMGDVIGSHVGRPQLKSHRRAISATKRQRFLDALALTCNITRAAAFAGVHATSMHRIRAGDAGFSAQWEAALAMGYDRLEAMVLEHGGAAVPLEPDPDQAEREGADSDPFDCDRAMKILAQRKAAAAAVAAGRHRGKPVRNASREETVAALVKALTAVQRRVAKRQAADG